MNEPHISEHNHKTIKETLKEDEIFKEYGLDNCCKNKFMHKISLNSNSRFFNEVEFEKNSQVNAVLLWGKPPFAFRKRSFFTFINREGLYSILKNQNNPPTDFLFVFHRKDFENIYMCSSGNRLDYGKEETELLQFFYKNFFKEKEIKRSFHAAFTTQDKLWGTDSLLQPGTYYIISSQNFYIPDYNSKMIAQLSIKGRVAKKVNGLSNIIGKEEKYLYHSEGNRILEETYPIYSNSVDFTIDRCLFDNLTILDIPKNRRCAIVMDRIDWKIQSLSFPTYEEGILKLDEQGEWLLDIADFRDGNFNFYLYRRGSDNKNCVIEGKFCVVEQINISTHEEKSYKKPKRRFENSGIVIPRESFHVNIDNVTNKEKEDIRAMIDKGRYFTIFSPGQSGKTTLVSDFCKSIVNDTRYISISLNFQIFQYLNNDQFYKKIYKDIQRQLLEQLKTIQCKEFEVLEDYMLKHPVYDHISLYDLFEKLNDLISYIKVVIIIDEFDCIPMPELSNFLMIIQSLYQKYKNTTEKAIYSVVFMGVRDITMQVIGKYPFTIADQVYLPPFSLKNICDLYAQYTKESNQSFSEAAIQEIFNNTCGQPWLVNRLGTILTVNIKPQTTESITTEDVHKAINLLLKEKNVHFENLYKIIHLYKETFLKILSQEIPYKPYDQSQLRLRQYGLIKEVNDKSIIANPIYKKYFSKIIDTLSVLPKKLDKRIFISYSREDSKWIDQLIVFLKPLKNKGIQIWYDKEIRPGDAFPVEIQNAIETAQMAICLISKHFLASEYIQKTEIPKILNRHQEGLEIIPLYLSICTWKHEQWLKNIQMFPKDGKPLSGKSEDIQQKVFTEIVDEIISRS